MKRDFVSLLVTEAKWLAGRQTMQDLQDELLHSLTAIIRMINHNYPGATWPCAPGVSDLTRLNGEAMAR
jgi:hypothetical protein